MKVVLVQLPIPKINFGLKTGNIPFGAACLKQAADPIYDCEVEILPEPIASYGGDQVLISEIADRKPDLVGFTIFSWNRDRAIYLAQKIKNRTHARIVFGGPEITPETVKTLPEFVDFSVLGEGETLFKHLLISRDLWSEKMARDKFGKALITFSNPFIDGHLDLGNDRVMLIETQRGCPYRCGFCYYNKANYKRQIADDRLVLAAIAWAMNNDVKEIYLMDPSLNTRPGIKHLLKKIARLNRLNTIPMTSEIRAESITPELAELYMKAGFVSFEVGLQSTNPQALEIMNRPTRLDRFTSGIKALQKFGIHATIDLIFGLPGDTIDGFRQTVQFILDNGFEEHVQVFPLLVLPGTDFRKNSKELGLSYELNPPYPVISTPGFSNPDLSAALDYAEDKFDRTFYPMPYLEVSYQSRSGSAKDHYIKLASTPKLAKLVIDHPRNFDEIHDLGLNICSPFQIFFSHNACNEKYIIKVLNIITQSNPFVPLEIVFLEPETLTDTDRILDALDVPRPHFLDLDQQFVFNEPGNRSVLFSLVTTDEQFLFEGPMKRKIMLWDRSILPGQNDLSSLTNSDGILIDVQTPSDRIFNWQEQMAEKHEQLPLISFSRIEFQNRWISLTNADQYNIPLITI